MPNPVIKVGEQVTRKYIELFFVGQHSLRRREARTLLYMLYIASISNSTHIIVSKSYLNLASINRYPANYLFSIKIALEVIFNLALPSF